jgi:hypothetical protein
MGTTTLPKTTSPLSQLELVAAKKPRNTPSALLRRRKLSNKLWEQIQLANSKLNRTPFSVMRTFTIKDLEGNRKTIDRPKRIKPWWFTAHDGQLCVSMFYGSKCLEIAPGKQAAQAKDLQHAIQILEIFKNEVEAGTFDAVIEKASGALRSCFDMKGKK